MMNSSVKSTRFHGPMPRIWPEELIKENLPTRLILKPKKGLIHCGKLAITIDLT